MKRKWFRQITRVNVCIGNGGVQRNKFIVYIHNLILLREKKNHKSKKKIKKTFKIITIQSDLQERKKKREKCKEITGTWVVWKLATIQREQLKRKWFRSFTRANVCIGESRRISEIRREIGKWDNARRSRRSRASHPELCLRVASPRFLVRESFGRDCETSD